MPADGPITGCPLLRDELEAVAGPLGLTVQTGAGDCPCALPPPAGPPGGPEPRHASLVCAGARPGAAPTCFHLVAGPTLVEELLAGGAHLVTPGWLRGWRGHLAAMGLDAPTAAALLGEAARLVVLLDTGVGADPAEELAAFAGHLGLPAERRRVGLDHLRLRVERLASARTA